MNEWYRNNPGYRFTKGLTQNLKLTHTFKA